MPRACGPDSRRRTRRLRLGTGDGDGGRHHGGHATNTVVQGSAADLAKAALASLDAALRTGGGGAFPPGAARPVLHLHDEVVLEVDAAWVGPVRRAVRAAMEGVAGAFGLSVPLPVRVSVGRAWGEMEAVEEEEGKGGQGRGGGVVM